MNCKHLTFHAHVDVARLVEQQEIDAGLQTKVKPIALAVDLTIHCRECGEPLYFTGMNAGVSVNGATVSVDRKEARLHGVML